ncbi:MAG: hypothetical protein F6K32_19850, partial [Desertifilum sp. SIO1I2]|nr:hypothetical protein [Desertifilum sp. SIO1I2]
MSIDPQRGTLHWMPTAEQVGKHQVEIRLLDAVGAYTVQAFSLEVRGVNTSPLILSVPPTLAAIAKPYSYAVLANDVENDSLTFSLVNPPEGMTINPHTGLINWTPASNQVGSHNISILVEDSQGGSVTQNFTVVVAQTAPNLAPTITSTPAFVGAVGELYRYNVAASDPEGQALTYQLIEKPEWLTINSTTGEITGTPPTTGTYQVVVSATDALGLGGAQRFFLNVTANQAPTITSTPPQVATPNRPYRYDVRATDANGDPLTYSLTLPPEGMTIDSLGRLVWRPQSQQVGNHAIEIIVKDTHGATATQQFNLNVQADTVAPQVRVEASIAPVGVGETVTFWVSATDNVGVESVQLTVNGTPVVLSPDGTVKQTFNTPGDVTLVATATDRAGNVSTTTKTLTVFDSSDTEGPVVALTPFADNPLITAPIAIKGTVSDPNLVSYTLTAIPIAGGQPIELFKVTGNTTIIDGNLGIFDPSLLPNDTYILQLAATDTGGNTNITEMSVDVGGDLKLGNFRLSFTDLQIPVSGIPISVTRTYDSLNANTTDDFG